MKHVLTKCDNTRYIDSSIKRPPASKDPEGACNWDKNDHWVQQVIIKNVTFSQMNHVGLKLTCYKMNSALIDMHDNKAHHKVIHIEMLKPKQMTVTIYSSTLMS